jgi:hypothetical protein
MDQPTAEEALARLEPLVGEWTMEARWPGGDAWEGGGAASFEWDDTHRLLLHRSSADLPEAPTVRSVIGCDAASGTYTQLYTDDRGVCRTYQMSIDGDEWQLWRTGEPFSQRFVGTFDEAGNTITARWEIAEDHTTFVTDFDLVFRRVTS